MGMIAGIAAIAAFIAALVMLILGGLGLMHARRVSPAADILTGHRSNGRDPGAAPLQATRSSDQPGGNGLVTTAPGSSDGGHSA
jgi:hypothetical protein